MNVGGNAPALGRPRLERRDLRGHGLPEPSEVARPDASGILVDYAGGNVGASCGSGTPSDRARQFLAQIEPVLPGLSRFWTAAEILADLKKA